MRKEGWKQKRTPNTWEKFLQGWKNIALSFLQNLWRCVIRCNGHVIGEFHRSSSRVEWGKGGGGDGCLLNWCFPSPSQPQPPLSFLTFSSLAILISPYSPENEEEGGGQKRRRGGGSSFQVQWCARRLLPSHEKTTGVERLFLEVRFLLPPFLLSWLCGRGIESRSAM